MVKKRSDMSITSASVPFLLLFRAQVSTDHSYQGELLEKREVRLTVHLTGFAHRKTAAFLIYMRRSHGSRIRNAMEEDRRAADGTGRYDG